MSEWKKTQCTICGVSCGLDVEVEDGKVISCRPDETSPRSHGYCCRKGRDSKYFIEHGDRLDYPMKREGDKFVRISWDKAISEISYKLRNIVDTYGPRAICGIGGASGGDQSELVFMRPLIEGLGGQYMFQPHRL
jgi:anaerobic selenocysteine-containing dehydrogenase